MANRKSKQEKEIKEQDRKAAFDASLRRSRIRYKKRIECLKLLALENKVVPQRFREVKFDDPELKLIFQDLEYRDKDFLNVYWRCKEPDKKKFWDFITDLDKKSTLLEESCLTKFWHIFYYRIFWAQSWEGWNFKGNNKEKQFFSLVNHLFSKYPLPKFTLKLWERAQIKDQYLDWFFHLASGKNIKSAENLPIKVSSKMAHFFLETPEKYDFETAFIYAQLKSLNADKKLIDEVCSNVREGDLKENDFWVTLYRYFINNPFLDRIHFQPLRDYIYNQKFAYGAPHPGFSLVNRHPQTLLDQMEAWHAELARVRANAARQKYKPAFHRWDPTFTSFKFEEGQGNNKTTWTIVELTSSSELREEGSELRHCVFSYAQSCFEKRIAILSLMNNGKKTGTLEINLASKQLVQARGKANRSLNAKELRAVNEWMQSNLYFKT